MFRRLREEQAEFLVNRLHRYCGARSLSDLKTIVLDLLMSSSMVFQPNSTISGLLGGVKTAICNDSSSTILELLQLADVCISSTTPDRTTVSKVGLKNTSVKSFQTSRRQKGFSVSQKANRPGDLHRNCLNLLFPV